jgi:hypothetical protein
VTVGDSVSQGKLLEVHCSSYRPERHHIVAGNLDLPRRISVAEIASCLVCKRCLTRETTTDTNDYPSLSKAVQSTRRKFSGEYGFVSQPSG